MELSYSQTDCVNVKSFPGMILAWTELSYSQTDYVNVKSVPGMILALTELSYRTVILALVTTSIKL